MSAFLDDLTEGEVIRIDARAKHANAGPVTIAVYSENADHYFNSASPDIPLISNSENKLNTNGSGLTFVVPKDDDYTIDLTAADDQHYELVVFKFDVSDQGSYGFLSPLPAYTP